MPEHNDKSDIRTAIKRLEAKRDAITIAINELRALVGEAPEPIGAESPAPPTPSFPSGSSSSGTAEIQSDTFFGMNTPTAAKKYLEMVKRPRSTREIANALQKGGVMSQSKNFTANVHTALHRDDAVVRVKNQWGLAEWYPGQAKGKQAKTERNGKQSDESGGDQSSASES